MMASSLDSTIAAIRPRSSCSARFSSSAACNRSCTSPNAMPTAANTAAVKAKRGQPCSGTAKNSAASNTDKAVEPSAPTRPASAPASTTDG